MYKFYIHSLIHRRFVSMLLVAALTTTAAYAQQQAMFTQYMFNGLALNPAYAGSHEAISLTALGREQWSGLPGSPSTQTFAAHAPLRFSRASVGLLLSRDDQDVSRQHGVFASYAYRIPVAKGQLALGLQGGFTQARTALTSLQIVTPGDAPDPTFGQDLNTGLLPNIGAGLYYHTERFYLGLSVPQLIDHQLEQEGALTEQAQLVRHYFLTGGYVFDLNPSLKFKPNFLIKSVPGAPVEADFNANLLIRETLWVGLGYRSFDALNALVQLQISPALAVGYAYDYTVSGLREVQSGSHELMLNYTIRLSKESVLSPRYF
ncbi:MAG: type IX secretion system membrane protein PorP/SprF [Tunicatimonas sp.]